MKSLLLKTLAATCILMTCLVLRAVSGDEHWENQFGWPGPGTSASTVAEHNGKYYVGVSSLTTNIPLEMWDGAQWSTAAQFYGPIGVTVVDLKFVGDTLYAAGTFTNVNGVTANGMAKWDGTNWSSVGNFSNFALCLAVDGGTLYVGGIFSIPASGGVFATNIAAWDGSAWHALGQSLGNGLSVSISVRAITVNNGLVYAGGAFTNSGPNFMTNIAVWDGSNWSAIGGGVDSNVGAILFQGSDMYVGGTFSHAGSADANLIAKWDGANWFAVGDGWGVGAISGLARLNGSIYATGRFTNVVAGATNFAVWNGSAWAGVDNGLDVAGSRIYSTATNVYVCGAFTTAGGIIANGLAAWDGVKWQGFGTPGRLNGAQLTVRSFVGTATNLYAGGTFTAAGQSRGNLIANFDGVNWHSMAGGVRGANNVVNALAISNSLLYVGGSFAFAGGVSAQNMAVWDGANWSALGSGPGGGPGSVVSAIVVTSNGVYAAGALQSGLKYSSPFFARWDGAAWQDSFKFAPNSLFSFPLNDTVIEMNSLAVQGSNIFIGGNFHMSPPDLSVNCSDIMRFDGTYMQPMGTGMNSNVLALAVLGINVYAGGSFVTAGGAAASHIARWNGSAWSSVGSGVVGSGLVDALAVIGTNLYAGGTFTNMGGVSASRIAKWDGNVWSNLGSGASATVLALYSSGSNLYAGGSFKTAGGKPSLFLGEWNDQANFNVPQFLGGSSLATGRFTARVYAVSGLTNIVEASTDLGIWTPVVTNSIGVYDFTDFSAGNYSRRFYRARLMP